MTRILTPAEYSLIAYVLVISLLMGAAASSWTQAALPRFGREELDRHGTMRENGTSRLVVAGPLLLLTALIVVAVKLLDWLPAGFSWPFVWIAIGAGVLGVASEHAILLLQAGGRMKLSAVGTMLAQALGIAALCVILATDRGQSALVIAGLTVATTLAATVVIVPAVWHLGLWPPVLRRSVFRRMLTFSAPLIAFSVSQYVIRSIDLVVLGALGTAREVGVYAVAYQAYTVLQGVAISSTTIFTPLFVSLHTAKRGALITRYLDRVVPQLTLLSAAAAGMAIPLIGPTVPLVFGSSFGDAADPLSILFVALLFFSVANLVAPILVLYERTRVIGLISVAAAVLNIVGDVLTVGPLGMGVTGPAVATSVCLALLYFSYFIVARQCLESTTPLRPILFGPMLGGLLPALLLPSAAAVPVGVIATAIVTVWVVAVVRPFAPEDAELIEKLDMPVAVKRLALRGIALAAR
jgi:O-antigen/teichoic acid export membrane protein